MQYSFTGGSNTAMPCYRNAALLCSKNNIDLAYTLHSASKSCKLPNKLVSENGGLKVLWKMKQNKKRKTEMKPLSDEIEQYFYDIHG